MAAREPLWSLADLAGFAKVTESALRERLAQCPIEQAAAPTDARIDSKFGSVCVAGRYRKSMLLIWFAQQDHQQQFKRKK